jgi:hypothetical protein
MNIIQQRNQQAATATRAKRQAAGKYQTPAQSFALKLYFKYGIDGLKPSDMELLATHPNLSNIQRSRFAALAAQENG